MTLIQRWPRRLLWPVLNVLRLLGRALTALMMPLRRLRERDLPLAFQAYRGYGDQSSFHFRGQIREDTEAGAAVSSHPRWQRFKTFYRRLASRGVAGATVRARHGEGEQQATTDANGFFEFWLAPRAPLAQDHLWQRVELELVEPRPSARPPPRATAEVLVAPSTARFGVISDIDDTVVYTGGGKQAGHALAAVRHRGGGPRRLPRCGGFLPGAARRPGPGAQPADLRLARSLVA